MMHSALHEERNARIIDSGATTCNEASLFVKLYN